MPAGTSGDSANPWAEALAIRGDTILALGDRASVTRLLGSETRVIAPEGGFAMPGFMEDQLASAARNLPVLGSAQPRTEGTMSSWTVLNLLAWVFGLRAVYDLRAELAPNGKTWVWLTWALWCCLLMELAMAGTTWIDGLALFSVATGVGSGVLLGLAFRSLHADVRSENSKAFDRVPRRGFAVAIVVILAGSSLLARALPEVNASLVDVLHPLEGAVWLGVSGWLAVAMMRWRAPYSETGTHYYRARSFACAFGFAFAGASLTPLGTIFGVAIDPALTGLLSSLFVLTLVTALYALVLRVRSTKLARTLTELHLAGEQLMTVERLVAVGTLAAGAAHDFNNCLTGIVAHAELASRDRSLSPEAREDIRAIEAAAAAATALTRNLMGIGRRSMGSRCRDVEEAVLAPLAGLEREFKRHHIDVVTHCERTPAVDVETHQVFQVCLNLYLNARDAMVPKGRGTLAVSLRAVADAIEIRVKDTGTGIPAAFRSRLFQPLATTKGERGTGLGLSGSKSIVESMGGRIACESTEGVGAEFIVTLPIARAARTSPGRPERARASAIG